MLLILSSSCGKKIIAPETSGLKEGVSIDPQVKPYFDSFMLKMSCFNLTPQYRSLIITINWEGIETAGYCVRYSDRSARIVLDGPTFAKISVINRERVIYHELGHCALNLPHIESDPHHIMYPDLYEQDGPLYVTEYDLRIRELFGNNPSSCNFFSFASPENN